MFEDTYKNIMQINYEPTEDDIGEYSKIID